MPTLTHSAHWGAFTADVEDGKLLRVRPFSSDPDPSPLLGNMLAAPDHSARVRAPHVRRGWLRQGAAPDARRGSDDYVKVSWDEAYALVARELTRVRAEHGSSAIFGGSYGWGSAGRFHHAQSQLHRFLNLGGGYSYSVNTYSFGAAQVLLPHVAGAFEDFLWGTTHWTHIVENTRLVIAFGGMPAKNTTVCSGGSAEHLNKGYLEAARARGTEFVLVGPIRSDLAESLGAEWEPARPGTDVALMLGMAHTLVTEGLADRTFVDRYCSGYDAFEAYLLGRSDDVPKSPAWAESICGIPAGRIRSLAIRAARQRTLITVTWSLQRTQFGEQPVWMGLALAALLGQIGLPGGGFGFGYGSVSVVGAASLGKMPTLEQGRNPVTSFIPCARIADMLFDPGGAYQYNGGEYRFPDIRLVYWAGGNPFHHHQNLPRLARAFTRPETIIVHEPFWTATAKHADIVLPVATSMERNDIGASTTDRFMIAMRQLVQPCGESKTDFEIYSTLSSRLGLEPAFSQGRNERAWLAHLYEAWRAPAQERFGELPTFESFWDKGILELPVREADRKVLFDEFRQDPAAHRLATPSGRIELWSQVIASFGYDDCPGHPVWLEPEEWLGAPAVARFPLQLIANNPRTRLHSQLDFGQFSAGSKIKGREPVLIHPDDARRRGIGNGDVVRIRNDRGMCLAGAVLSAGIRPGCIQLSTGAWYDPRVDEEGVTTCVHGNPNVLTEDRACSRLSQGPTGQLSLVEVERYAGPLPPMHAWQPPVDAQT